MASQSSQPIICNRICLCFTLPYIQRYDTNFLLEEMGNMLLAGIKLAISVMTTARERGFSSMNLEKTSQRTQMRPDTLDFKNKLDKKLTKLHSSNLIQNQH